MTTSTSRSATVFAAASATLSSVALSSTKSSTGRPSRPPRSFMSSITISATLTLAIPMKERAPVWSVMKPTRAGRLIGVVIVVPSCVVRAELERGLGLSEVAGLRGSSGFSLDGELQRGGMSSVGARNEVVLSGLAFEVLAEVGVREADHRLRPLGDRLALEVDAAVLGDDVHRVGSRCC